VRNAIVILVVFGTGFLDAFQQQLISRKTWDRPVHEVLHIEAVRIWMARALLQNQGK
jgi:hypothetical protein